MKRIIQGLVLATLISTAQASPFPEGGEPSGLAPEWTYADRHSGGGNMQVGSAFPEGGEPSGLPAQSTYADRFATDRARHVSSSIE